MNVIPAKAGIQAVHSGHDVANEKDVRVAFISLSANIVLANGCLDPRLREDDVN